MESRDRVRRQITAEQAVETLPTQRHRNEMVLDLLADADAQELAQRQRHGKLLAILAAIPPEMRCGDHTTDRMEIIDWIAISIHQMSKRAKDTATANDYAETVTRLYDEINELHQKLRIPDQSRDFVNECNDIIKAKEERIKTLEQELELSRATIKTMRQEAHRFNHQITEVTLATNGALAASRESIDALEERLTALEELSKKLVARSV